uniref:DUF4773 domain-containing protein n=1 Tax=Arion vulgaris TaxID=1028688 RepID=A0A0B7BB67_9EUPU
MLPRVCLIIVASLSVVSSMKIREIETAVKTDAVYLMHFMEKEYKEIITDLKFSNNSSCSCVNYTCGCCVDLVIPKISLNETGCLIMSYLPDEYGFQIVFTLNGLVIMSEKISVKNPPPICAPVPYAHELANICIRFYNLDYKEKQFSGCADIEVDLEGVVLKKYDLGCFHIPPSHKSLLYGRNATSTKP